MRPALFRKTFKLLLLSASIVFGFFLLRSSFSTEGNFLSTVVYKINSEDTNCIPQQFVRQLVGSRSELGEIEPEQLLPITILGNATKRKIVMTIPVVERTKGSYLIETLNSLMRWMDEEDRKEAILMIFVTGTDDFVHSTARDIQKNFRDEIASGLIEVNRIPWQIYPSDWEKVPSSFGDSRERIIWRSKQGIDFMYIMLYASYFGDYCLQLEDDIHAAKGFVKNILSFIEMRQDNWTFAQFSGLGFIGKLFRSSEAADVSKAMGIYWKYKPVDWIISDYVRSMHCSLEWNTTRCTNEVKQFIPSYLPAQFQHIGWHSSLKGKIQKLKEKTFSGIKERKANKGNPPAVLETSLSIEKFSLVDTYVHGAFLWLSPPEKGKRLNILFKNPQKLKGVVISSGSQAQPNNRFDAETFVEAKYGNGTTEEIGQFSSDGRFYERLDCKETSSLHLVVSSSISNPVVIDQITIYTC